MFEVDPENNLYCSREVVKVQRKRTVSVRLVEAGSLGIVFVVFWMSDLDGDYSLLIPLPPFILIRV